MEKIYENVPQYLNCENENSEIDFEGTVIKVDTKTKDGNYQREDAKTRKLCESTIVHNVPKAMKIDVKGDVIKTELKSEIGNDSESDNTRQINLLGFSK